jgi:hypothetical protein
MTAARGLGIDTRAGLDRAVHALSTGAVVARLTRRGHRGTRKEPGTAGVMDFVTCRASRGRRRVETVGTFACSRAKRAQVR